MLLNTRSVWLTGGKGTGSTRLNALDRALYDAGIADFNIVRISSIIPLGATVYRLDKGGPPISGGGRILPTAYASVTDEREGTRITCGIGVGAPTDRDKSVGVIFEVSGSFDETEATTLLRTMVDEGLRKTRGTSEYEFYSEVSSTVVAGISTAVFAGAVLCDDELETLFETRERNATGARG